MKDLEQTEGVKFWEDYLNDPKNKVDGGTSIDVSKLVKEGKISKNFFDNFEEKLEEKGVKVKKVHNFCIENLIALKGELVKLEKGSESLIYYIKEIIKKSTEADYNYIFGDGKFNEELEFIKNDKRDIEYTFLDK